MSEILVNIITFILYLIALVLIVIFVLAIINYALYTVYSIKEIVVHNTLDDAMFYKLKDIYNYRLVNYVNIINTNNYYNRNIFENIDSRKIRTIDTKKFTLIYNKDDDGTVVNSIDLTYLKDFKTDTDGNNIVFELENIDSIKDKDFVKIYKKITYSSDDEHIVIDHFIKYKDKDEKDKIYKIRYINENLGYLPEININKSISDIILLDTTNTDANVIGKKLIGKNGIIYAFDIKDNHKYLNDSVKKSDIYGYILNGLYILFPTTLLWSYDNHATALYVKTNNNLYEIILLLLFIIILIIFLAFIGDFYNFIFGNNAINKDAYKDSLFINKIIENNRYYLILIIFALLAYCILHSIIYFFIFINGTYKRIRTIYDDLIIADEYIRSEVNNNLILNNSSINSKDILDAFIKIAYGNDIKYMKGKYSVIDETNSENIDETIRKFEENMLAINYSFNFNKEIYSQNNYTNAFFNSIYNILIVDNKSINKTLLNIIIIYVYFVRNNVDDPYILIKLNKLIFGRVANVGIKKIDDEIDFTLSLKSLLGHNLQKREIIDDLNDISTKLFEYINDENKSGFTNDIITKINLRKDNDTFITKFTDKLYIVRLEYWGAVYFFNLYLVAEIMLNAVIILIILMIIKYTDNDMRQKVVYYITVITAFIVLMIDEIQTAILGVI